ncbi:hypothetical protein FF1_042077 [Malus domestica]
MVEFTEKDFDASLSRMIAMLEVARLATEDLMQEELKLGDRTPVELKMQKMSLKNNTKKGVDTMNIALKKKELITPSASLGYHDLPEEFKREIERLSGTKVELVIEKQLTKTDISSSTNRMSMPLNQLISISFLEDEDKEMLENCKTMTVQLIDPGLVQGDINLRRLVMGKEKKPGSAIFVLRTQWGDVARKNKLKAGDVVQESDDDGDSECKSSIVDGGSMRGGTIQGLAAVGNGIQEAR